MLGSLCSRVMHIIYPIPPFFFYFRRLANKVNSNRQTGVIHVTVLLCLPFVLTNYMDFCMWSSLGVGPVYKIRYLSDSVIKKLPKISQLP